MNVILAVAIATIGAFHDMNYLDAKKELVEITGHPELVVNSAGGDFDDHVVPERPKAKTYLNKANRRIEDALVELKAEEERIVPISAGQYALAMNDLRYVSRIDLETSEKRFTALRRQTLDWIRDYFRFPYDLITRGIPRWWTRGPAYSELLTNTTFNAGITGWTFNAGGGSGTATWLANGSVILTGGAEGFLSYFEADIPTTDLADAIARIDVLAFTPSPYPVYLGFTFFYQFMNSLVPTSNGSITRFGNRLGIYETRVEALQPTYDRVQIILLPGASLTINTASVQVPNEAGMAAIQIFPPSDAAYTAHVFGGYYAHAFDDDTDETWASVNCSNALLLMAKAYVSLLVEGDSKTFKELETQALREASEVWANSIHEQIEGIPIEEQRFGPISFGPYAGNTGEAPMYQWDDA